MLAKSLLIAALTLSTSAFAADKAKAAPTAAVPAAAAGVLSYEEAPKFYNQTKTVEGTVVGTFCSDKMCFLNFHKDYKTHLSAVIDAANFSKFSKATGKDLGVEMEKMYVGKKVQITGMLNEYKSEKEKDKPGRPQILLTDVKNIKVVTK